MGGDRGARTDIRQRRQFQKLTDGPFIIGPGLEVDPDTVPLPTLSVDVDENSGLAVHPTDGIQIDLASPSGLEFDLGDLRVDLNAPRILVLTASGIETPFFSSLGTDSLQITSGVAAQIQAPFLDLFADNLNITAGSGTIFNASFLFFTSYDIDATTTGNVFWHIVSGYATIDAELDLTFASTGGSVYFNATVDITLSASGINLNGGGVSIDGDPVIVGSSGQVIIQNNSAGKIGFFATPSIFRPGTYTIVAAPAVSTALDADANAGVNYTAIADTGATNLAAAADLNNLRADVQSLSAVLRQLIRHLGDTAGFGLVNDTGY